MFSISKREVASYRLAQQHSRAAAAAAVAVLNELTKGGLADACTLIERLKPTCRR